MSRYQLTTSPLLPLLLALFLPVAALTGCSKSSEEEQSFEERCANGQDDDGDGFVDCADPSCALYPSCQTQQGEHCYNGRDDDGDGKIDCEDESCQQLFLCDADGEDCVNGKDDDGDGKTDCADPACAATAACAPGAEDCTNGLDEDGDAKIDCDDDDCKRVFVCLSPFELCGNGKDDDRDGKQDCEDEDCQGTSLCTPNAEACANGQDDDGDGATDCADLDCANTFECLPLAESCTNGIDDNGDGRIDCEDSLCAGASVCALPRERCTNGVDDNANGKIDCEDSQCEFTATCLDNVEACTNGVDDNGDGKIDCEDEGCRGIAYCDELTACGDLKDNDADGAVDEGCPCDIAQRAVGICAQAGVLNEEGACVEPPVAYEPEETTCEDMVDNDCDGVVDEGCACLFEGKDVGVCAQGARDASSGACVTSFHEADETSCDGKDNDCDGVVDEGCPCQYDDLTAGVCASATLRDALGACPAPAGYEQEETQCDDSLDNDCDGQTNEGCGCDYLGSAVGVCAGGINQGDGTCGMPATYDAMDLEGSIPALCDGNDNDCDGVVDEGCVCDAIPALEMVSQGVCLMGGLIDEAGACALTASTYEDTHPPGCLSGGPGGPGGPGSRSNEDVIIVLEGRCGWETQCSDNLDNDCDGIINEGCACDYNQLTEGVCSGGVLSDTLQGECLAPFGYDMADDEAAAGRCDGLDNDCDGAVDEGCACDLVIAPSTFAQGVCVQGGTRDQNNACTGTPPSYESTTTETLCGDGLDNNCDGFIDEGCACDLIISPQTASRGVCVQGGGLSQSGACVGSPSSYEATETSCGDGLDNDCDGAIDCGDPDCMESSTALNCRPESDCFSTSDANGNGLLGFNDPDCAVQGSDWLMVLPAEDCADGIDNDLDTFTDCADHSCAQDPRCTGVEVCGDRIDNDADGSVDCADLDCQYDYKCHRMGELNCTDGVADPEDLNDTDADCDDSDCGRDRVCYQEICQGGSYLDADFDGLYPERDPDCAGIISSVEVYTEFCNDSVDNNLNGLTDCAEPSCAASSPSCQSETQCTDGLDNNLNGLIDCADPDCFAACSKPAAPPESCLPSQDLDGDNRIACADPDCAGHILCNYEICDDFQDNNPSLSPGADCADPACTGTPACSPELCGEYDLAAMTPAPSPLPDQNGNRLLGCADYNACDFSSGSSPSRQNCQHESPSDCESNVDTNGNDLTGCDEPTCHAYIQQNFPFELFCEQSSTEICGDGMDNDLNGKIDCEDPGCMADPGAGCELQESDCGDGLDGDHDRFIDCADIDCAYSERCQGREYSCGNGTDDDGDGLIDCLDPDCSSFCFEDCGDVSGEDEDGNGFANCDDLACENQDPCRETMCSQNLDNDNDGTPGCLDSNCAFDQACMMPGAPG